MTPRVSRQPARDLDRGSVRRWQWPRRIAGATFRLAARRPSRTLLAMLLVSGAGAFAWNALMQQPNRHPHPLFAKADLPPEPPRRPDAQASPPLPVPRPDMVGVAAPARKEEARVKAGSAADPIGALIRGESAGPASGSASAAADTKSSPRVATAQKALTKLGYGPIEPDGVFGNATRTALEKFERDTKIPVTGSLGRRTSKQLAALSGYSIE